MDTTGVGGDEDSDFVSPTWQNYCLYSFIALVSFWIQANVTEERFVPALSIISDVFNIPDDVAGATLMAAGASSPELFSSIVALFITHSSLGLGTVVGSEIFNQLTICAGSIFASRNRILRLDKAIAIREMTFYGLSLVLLLVAISERKPATDEEISEGADGLHLYISLGKASLLFIAYLFYVLVLAKFDVILKWIDYKVDDVSFDSPVTKVIYGSVDQTSDAKAVKKMPFLKMLRREPSSNFSFDDGDSKNVTALYTKMQGEAPIAESIRSWAMSGSSGGNNDGLTSSLRESVSAINTLSKRVLTLGLYDINTSKPSDDHSLLEISKNEFDETLSCFLWQRSRFYSKSKVARTAWDLRFFTFGAETVTSVSDTSNVHVTAFKYPKFDCIVVDSDHLTLKLIKEGNGDKSDKEYILMSPSWEILEEVVKKCQELMGIWESSKDDDENLHDQEDGDEHHEAFTDFPYDGSTFAILVHFILYPLKLIMQLTLPDVRQKGSTINTAWMAVLMCLVWLIIGSFTMVRSLEILAGLLNIPDAVVGVTVSAAGTSLPNYVGSQVAARKGLGNMAVSNAFGSNTFNILVGLGLPWVLYTSIVTKGEPYHSLTDDGITGSIIFLAAVLIFHVVLLMVSNFVMYNWHAITFLALYCVYLVYAILPVYMN